MKVPDQVELTKNIGRDVDVTDQSAPGGAFHPGEGKRLRLPHEKSRRAKQSKKRVLATISNLIDSNRDKYQAWMEQVARENPGKALALTIALLEYVAPKLGRIEQTGTVEHKVSHFVPVTEREQRPAIEGEATEVKPTL